MPVQGKASAAREDLRQALLSWDALDEKKERDFRGMTFEAARSRLMTANSHINEASATLLLQRGLRPLSTAEQQASPSLASTGPGQSAADQPQQFVFSRDLSIRQVSAIRLSFEQTQTFMQHVTCPVLVVLADDGVKYQIEQSKKHLEVLRQRSRLFQYHRIPGSHHVHMNEPEQPRRLWLAFLQRVLAAPQPSATSKATGDRADAPARAHSKI